MDQQKIIAEMEVRAKALDLPMTRICEEAGVHPTTFSRWKKSERNPNPIGASLKSLAAIDAALSRFEPSPREDA